MSLNLDKSRWTRVALGDVTIASKEKCDPRDGSVERYVAGEHMDSDDMKLHRWGDVGEVDLGPAFHRRFHPGQVLYGSRRTYLRKVAVADFDGVCANTTFVVETKNDSRLLQEFLPFVMSSEPFHAFAIAESKGSVNPYVNWSDIERYEFELPPLDEQQRLADLLWAVEDECRSIGEVLASLERVRSERRDELFRSIDSPCSRFDSLCSIPSQNGVALKKSERAGTVPMVNMGEMFRGEVIETAADYERVVHPGAQFLLGPGDLLFARRSIVFEGAGACCLVPELGEAHTFESSVIRSRLRLDAANPRYVLHYFRSERGRDAVSQIVRRGPVSGIAGSDLRALELPVPNLSVQEHVVREIDRASLAGPLVDRRGQKASLLRQALLTSIFGGE